MKARWYETLPTITRNALSATIHFEGRRLFRKPKMSVDEVTKRQMRDLITSGKFDLKKTPNLGSKGAAKILFALGLPTPKRHTPSESEIKRAANLLVRAGYDVIEKK